MRASRYGYFLDGRSPVEHCLTMEFFVWFENTPLSSWVRESPLVFPTILIVHALGMGSLVGINIFIGMRLLGFVRSISAEMLRRFLPIVWLGFFASLASGLLLLAAYPAKALTNPIFYLKFALIAAALGVLHAIRNRAAMMDELDAMPAVIRISAVVMMVLWGAAITAGRFLAYTHSVLLASHLY
jgi:hypothetical protein